MDSMRSLNTSLPQPRRNASSNRPSEQLLAAFKAAALSVTKLYRTAESDETQTRSAGYQDALEDLLTFMDDENIGLDDGEGWRIRQWATERLDPGMQTGSDSEEDKAEASKQDRSASPSEQRHTNPQQESTEIHLPESSNTSPAPPESATLATSAEDSTTTPPAAQPSSETFTFRSTPTYPQDTDMQASSHEPSITVNVMPRNPKPSRNSRIMQKPGALSSRNLGSGAGSKRRIHVGDYFDLGSLPGEAPGPGNKRGRLS